MGDLTANPSLRKMYLAAINGPSLDHDALEFGVDCFDHDILAEHIKFQPKKIMDLLIDHASSSATSPESFQKEILEFIAIKLNIGKGNSCSKDRARFEVLKTKYRIYTEGEAPVNGAETDVITTTRLFSIFPHYCLPLMSDLSFTSSLYGPSSCVLSFYFGAVIPTRMSMLSLHVRKAIIVVHLNKLESEPPKMPLRTHAILLRKRIETSLLSNDRRIRILQNFHVITVANELSESMKKAYDCIKLSDSQIPQNIFK